MRKAYYNSNGKLRIFLDTDGEDLTGWTEVDLPSDYDDKLYKWDNGYKKFIKDFSIINKELSERVDKEAGEFRKRFVTDITGQELTYRLKEEEALAWTEGSDPNDFPYLQAEAQEKGIEIEDLVSVILQSAQEWKQLNPKIEAKRAAAKEKIVYASTVEEKLNAANIEWDSLL